MPRLVVNPGDPVVSTWGNTVFDQSVQAFTNTADRATQWPTPLDGSMSYTTDTGSLWVRRGGVWKMLPLGFITSAIGPVSQVDVSTLTTVMSLTATLTAGRRYRLYAYAGGSQQTSVGNATYYLVTNVDSGSPRIVQVQGLAIGQAIFGSGAFLVTPGTSGSRTFNLQGFANAGVLRTPANNVELSLDDIGSQ